MRAAGAEALTAAFSLFLHDLRGSLGAATGCLRMAHGTEGAAMIANATQALRAISQLIQHASTWLDALEPGERAREWVRIQVFATAVARALASPTAAAPALDQERGLMVSSVDGVAAAVATIVGDTAGPEPGEVGVTIEPHGDALVIACGTPADRTALATDSRRHAAPGSTTSFPLIAAYHVIAAHGGAVWTLDPPHRAVAVALPLERA